jgi:hypothetical protein
MAIPVLILGKSGSGKSASLRKFDGKKTFIVNVLGKPLPFKKTMDLVYNKDNYSKIKAKLLGAATNKIKTMVIDDSGYLITNKFMNQQSTKKGNEVFAFYSQLATDFWGLIEYVKTQLPKDVIVYFIMHEEKSDIGDIKPKTIGKMLDDKVCVEGLFSIVLRSVKDDKKYVFKTQSNGLDVSKTPMEMFDSIEIENDLNMVNNKIREYYKLDKKGENN